MTSTVLDQLKAHATGEPVALKVAGKAKDDRVVGSYARISDAYEDKFTGVTEDGVKRQLAANVNIAAARHWPLAERLYVDNSVSAFKRGVVRDAFEELLDDLEAGVIDGIVCYNLDRFARQVGDLERAIKIYDDAKRKGRELLFATAEGDLNLASDDGLTMARVMVAFANKSSRDTARRVAGKHQALRDEGKPVGGWRPFGWDWQRNEVTDANGVVVHEARRVHVVNEVEADLIRQAAVGLTNASLTWAGVVNLWNAAGVLTPRGTHWRMQTVKQVMRSPRLAGWQVHRDRIAVHSKTGQLIRSNNPPIMSDDDFMALCVVTDGKGGYTKASGRAKYLLTGIVRCAECGTRLTGGKTREGSYNYGCKPGNGKDGSACGRVTASGRGLDELLVELVLPRIIEETGGLRETVAKPYTARLVQIEDERARLVTSLRDKVTTPDVAYPDITLLDAEADELRRLQAEWLRDQRVIGRNISITPDTWPTLDMEERRAHMARHIEAVYVTRATRQGPTFDVTRVSDPVWRTSAAAGELADVAQR